MDSTIGAIVMFLLCITPAFIMFCVPYGDNVVIYDTIRPYNQHIANGEYHFSGIVASSECGTLMDRFVGMRPYEFVVDGDRFSNSFQSSMSFRFTCKGGQVRDIVWGS